VHEPDSYLQQLGNPYSVPKLIYQFLSATEKNLTDGGDRGLSSFSQLGVTGRKNAKPRVSVGEVSSRPQCQSKFVVGLSECSTLTINMHPKSRE